MANVKPAALRTGHTSNEEIKARKEAEDKLKGSKSISTRAPNDLSKNAKKLYKEIISLLPDGFLNSADKYTVKIVAQSLERMDISSKEIDSNGLFTEDGKESEASKAYERYSKTFDKFSAKLGLSPKDRAALAAIIVADRDNQEDELLKALKGDDD